MDRVKSDIEDQSYYLSTADGTVLQRQVRFNVRRNRPDAGTRPLMPLGLKHYLEWCFPSKLY